MAVAQFAFMTMGADVPAGYAASANVEAETVSGTHAPTTAAANAAQNVVRVVSDTACYISFGSAPNAGTDPIRYYMPANVVEYYRVKEGDKASVIAA